MFKLTALASSALITGILVSGAPLPAQAQAGPSAVIAGLEELPEHNGVRYTTSGSVHTLNISLGTMRPLAGQQPFICITGGLHLPIGGVVHSSPTVKNNLWGSPIDDCAPHSMKVTFSDNNPVDFSVNFTAAIGANYNYEDQQLLVSYHNFDARSPSVSQTFKIRENNDFAVKTSWKVDGRLVADKGTAYGSANAKVEADVTVRSLGPTPLESPDRPEVHLTIPEGFTLKEPAQTGAPGWTCERNDTNLICRVQDQNQVKPSSVFTLVGPQAHQLGSGSTSFRIAGAADSTVASRAVQFKDDINPANDELDSMITLKEGQAPPPPAAPPAAPPVIPPPVAPPAPAPNPPQPPVTEQPSEPESPIITPPEYGTRPSWIPPVPKRPSVAPVARAKRSEAVPSAETRAAQWVDAVVKPNETVDTVLIGRNSIFADSLASGGLQGILNAPLLLNPEVALADTTRSQLKRLSPKRVYLLGGPKAISPQVETELRSLGLQVNRIAGPSRIETAIEAARQVAPKATHALLARAYDEKGGSSSQAFADALGSGALAAKRELPMLLTESGQLSAPVATYLKGSAIKQVTVIGGDAAISPTVVDALTAMGITVTRLSGQTRADTAVRVAQAQGYWHAGEAAAALVVDGEDDHAWTDAFPAALFAKRYQVPVVLTGKAGASPETTTWLKPGEIQQTPTRVFCGFSVGLSQSACTLSPGNAT